LNLPWCISVFKDNAGVIEFDDKHAVCFKVETHNHPSAIEPYGGANTGLGGVIRDPLGTGLGAKPVCNTDVFCWPSDMATSCPGVTRGASFTGRGRCALRQPPGIPTINGACFDDDYVATRSSSAAASASCRATACAARRAPATASSCSAGARGATASTARPSHPRS
jgi:phosphoribosylformylglycinamidine synthase